MAKNKKRVAVNVSALRKEVATLDIRTDRDKIQKLNAKIREAVKS